MAMGASTKGAGQESQPPHEILLGPLTVIKYNLMQYLK